MFELSSKMNEERIEEIGEDHIGTSAKTPLRADAFAISDKEKIERIQESVKDILITLGMDLEDDSLQGTPKRVAKAWVNELFGGLNPENMPKISKTSKRIELKCQMENSLTKNTISTSRERL